MDRRTANTAVRALRAEGLARSERGRGTFVAEVPVITRHAMTRYDREARERAGSRGAFDGEIRAMGLEPHTDVTVSTGPAAEDVAGGAAACRPWRRGDHPGAAHVRQRRPGAVRNQLHPR